MPYWLKGYGDLGYVLKDQAIIGKARNWIEAVLAGQAQDGWFGPRELQKSLEGKPDMWPHMVMLNVLQSYYEYSGDGRVLPFLTRYFRWQLGRPDSDSAPATGRKVRMGDNLESVYWLYNRTGEAWLLDLARRMHENMADWTSGVCDWHNVNIAQGFREPADLLHAGEGAEISGRRRAELSDGDGRCTASFPAADSPATRTAAPATATRGRASRPAASSSSCTASRCSRKISGEPLWADRCEEIAFNSLPAALTPDLKALHYLTAANMVQLDRQEQEPRHPERGHHALLQPVRGLPLLPAQRLARLALLRRGIVAGHGRQRPLRSLYAASEVKAKVGDGTAVKIVEETDYPFERYDPAQNIACPRPVRFPLYLRVPRWSGTPVLTLNGSRLDAKAEPLSYLVVERQWSDGDTVSLQLPMRLAVRTWKKNNDAVSVDYGPLDVLAADRRALAALRRRRRLAGVGGFSDDALELRAGAGRRIRPSRSSWCVARDRWPGSRSRRRRAPLELQAKAKRIPGWQQDRMGLIGPLQPSPVKSDEPVETGNAHSRWARPGCESPPFRRLATVPTPTRGCGRENDAILRRIAGS